MWRTDPALHPIPDERSSMSYQALARKYRPETFAQVVGQTHVTGTLRAALRKEKLSHAYLFSGPRGCGKTTVARLLAKAINCLTNREGDPCGTCETCLAIARGNYLDVLEIDADRYTRKCDGHRVNHRDVRRSDFMPEVASEHLGGSECQNHDREFQLLVLASVAKRGGES